MLVLSRKKNETLFIGDNIKIQVIDIHHGQVRLGIEAPKDVPIFREEIYEDIQSGRRPQIPHSVR